MQEAAVQERKLKNKKTKRQKDDKWIENQSYVFPLSNAGKKKEHCDDTTRKRNDVNFTAIAAETVDEKMPKTKKRKDKKIDERDESVNNFVEETTRKKRSGDGASQPECNGDFSSKKRKHDYDDGDVVSVNTIKSIKKKRKSHKESNRNFNHVITDTQTDDNSIRPKKKKKSKCRLETERPTATLNEDTCNTVVKKKKKKKRMKEEKAVIEKETEDFSLKKSSFVSASEYSQCRSNAVDGKNMGGVVLGQWSTANFESKDRQEKFLRLMGGFKKSNEKPKGLFGGLAQKFASQALSRSDEKVVNERLETDFNRAMDFRLGTKMGGLGYAPPQDSNKNFHIDVKKSNSIKFDE